MTSGVLSAAQIITDLDALSDCLLASYAGLGLGLAGETGTAAANALLARYKILGGAYNGVTYPGLGNSDYQQSVAPALDALAVAVRWDVLYSRQGRSFIFNADSNILNNLPPAWSFSNSNSLHLLNNHLLRLNACHAGVPAVPAAAGVLTATTNAAGAIASTSSGNAPRILHTLVGANQWDESPPSAEATQVAIAGTQNGYIYQIAGTVPVGVTEVNIYRTYAGAAGAPYYFDQTYPVTAGAAYPAILILQADAALLTSWNPPSWMSCMLRAEAAALIALTYAVGGGQSVSPGKPILLLAPNMVDPANVLLNASNSFLGLGNPAQSAIFGSRTLGTAFVAGAIQTANNAPTGVQGFLGATKLRARATTSLNGTLHPTISYTYYDAAHGFGSIQTQTGVTPASDFAGSIAGETITFTITAGRVVLSVTETATSGTATTGAYVYEGIAPRP